jgi:hypothetical protein
MTYLANISIDEVSFDFIRYSKRLGYLRPAACDGSIIWMTVVMPARPEGIVVGMRRISVLNMTCIFDSELKMTVTL